MPRQDATNHAGSVGLPPMLFLFTTDQIAMMLNISEDHLMVSYLYYVGRSSGLKKTHQMDAINIAPEGEKPVWRVNANEFIRWCRRRGITTRMFTNFS